MQLTNLKKIRTARGCSRRALAEKTGLSPQAIYYLEKGTNSARPSTAKLLALVLDTNVADLCGEPAKVPA